MKNYISAAQLWGLTTAYVDMCNNIKLYNERNELKIQRNSSIANTDSRSVSWEYTDLLKTTESSCRKLGNKIVDFINERFGGNLQEIKKGYYDPNVVEKALKIIEENIVIHVPEGTPVPEEKPCSEGITSEEAYSLWKK